MLRDVSGSDELFDRSDDACDLTDEKGETLETSIDGRDVDEKCALCCFVFAIE